MIISASRRTDIPALYSRWLGKRIEEGYCTVPNPFNQKQVAHVSLDPADVDAIVFWTRHARPMFELLPLLDKKGFRYYFQYTITGYGAPVEARTPGLDVAIATFVELAERRPEASVIWRYDPILIGKAFAIESHLERFARIARALQGSTRRVVLSIVDPYQRTQRRMGQHFRRREDLSDAPADDPCVADLLQGLARLAKDCGMTAELCAEPSDWSHLGLQPTKCIDNRLLHELFGGAWETRKDPGQRTHCCCIPAKDIGINDTCTFGCSYCYATRSDALAQKRYRQHDPCSPSLFGWY